MYNIFFSIETKIQLFYNSISVAGEIILRRIFINQRQFHVIELMTDFTYTRMIAESILDHRADARVCVSRSLADNSRWLQFTNSRDGSNNRRDIINKTTSSFALILTAHMSTP